MQVHFIDSYLMYLKIITILLLNLNIFHLTSNINKKNDYAFIYYFSIEF